MSDTYRKKIDWLLRYCMQYTAHDYMYDERVSDSEQFNVDLGIEEYILSNLTEKRIILLTGDAGDGKTRVLSNLKSRLDNTWTIVNDFSALAQKEQIDLMSFMQKSLLKADGFDKKFAIAANTGILLNSISKYCPGLERELRKNKEACIVQDFSKRNLAMQNKNQNVFKKILNQFYSLDSYEKCASCKLKDNCTFISNLYKLADTKVQDGLQLLYHSLYIMGVHVTFRELLSTLAYLVTGGLDCEQLCSGRRRNNALPVYYNNLFDCESKGNPVIEAFHKLDIAKKDIDKYDEQYYSLNQNGYEGNSETKKTLLSMSREKRRLYFEEPEMLFNASIGDTRYDLLAMPFLKEYSEFLRKLKINDFLDSVDDSDSILQLLEMGLNKISDPYCTNSQMVLHDSPPLTSGNSQLEYVAERPIRLLFCTPAFFFSNGAPKKSSLNNQEDLEQCICVVFDEDIFEKTKTLDGFPRLCIDYSLFCEILFAGRSVFRRTNAKLSENTHIRSYTKQIFNTVTGVEKFSIVWADTKKDSAKLQVSLMKAKAFSQDKAMKFQISK